MSVTNPNGHVKIYRQLENSQVWRNAELLKVWLWCLLRASWQERWVDAQTGKGTTEVHLMPGEFIFGRFEAAAALQMKPSSVRNRMDKLNKMGNLTIKVDTHWSIVTICNWATYQAVPEGIGQAGGQATDTQGTGNGQAKDTNKNGKKGTEQEEGKEIAPAADAAKGASKPKKPRPPNPYWDEICRIWGLKAVTKADRTRIGKLSRDLRAKCEAVNAGPPEIAARHKVLASKWGDPEMATPEALCKWWDSLKAIPHQTQSDAAQEQYLRSIGFFNDRPKPGIRNLQPGSPQSPAK